MTVCATCGAQPIDWHHADHRNRSTAGGRGRIAILVGKGYPNDVIEAEIDRCTPLCRRCHQAYDGRRAALLAGHISMHAAPQTCADCGRVERLAGLGLCNACYQRQRYHQRKAAGITRNGRNSP